MLMLVQSMSDTRRAGLPSAPLDRRYNNRGTERWPITQSTYSRTSLHLQRNLCFEDISLYIYMFKRG